MSENAQKTGHPMRVAVGLSGGVDSSVAALLLQRAGYEVIGLTMQIWDGAIPLPDTGRSGCFGPGEARDLASAKAVADRLGIRHVVVPLAEAYRREVLDYFRAEYLAGRTPNPCVRCNRAMKFGLLLEGARAAGVDFDRFATGHYARVARDGTRNRWVLRRARDERKDQTYFLAQLRQQQLAQLLLPLGELTKEAVRAVAVEAGWADLAAREESQDFIESDRYDVLFAPGEARPGPILDLDGRPLGRHRGLIHYTVGQRKGLGIGGAGEALYVVALDAPRNTVVVGPRDALGADRLLAGETNWIALSGAPETPLRAEAKIRQQHTPAPGDLSRAEDAAGETIAFRFDEPQNAVTPGQTVVFYDGDLVLGSGTIACPTEG